MREPRYSRYFTVEEANALIPELTMLIERIRLIKAEVTSNIVELEAVVNKARANGGYGKGTTYLSKITRFYDYLNQIEEMGCLLRDIDLGIVDFPSIHDGRVVYLCWKLGEERVSFWHEVDAGFAGRKPIR
jgi:hypothetical protein